MYLSYTEYVAMGGTLDGSAFSAAERRAEYLINAQAGGQTGHCLLYTSRISNVNCDHSDVIINTLNERRYIFGKTYKPPLEDRPFLFSILMAQGRFKLVDGELSLIHI